LVIVCSFLSLAISKITKIRANDGLFDQPFLQKLLDAGREKCPRTVEEAKRWVGEYIEHYNTARLHSAIGYVTPLDMLEGRQGEIHAERDRKLAQARDERRQRRQLNHEPAVA